jgi:hypothetical protein
MKTLRHFCATLTLVLALTFSAFGGEIGFPGTTTNPPPPEQESSMTEETVLTGATSTGETSDSDLIILDPVTDAALSMLQSLLFFF